MLVILFPERKRETNASPFFPPVDLMSRFRLLGAYLRQCKMPSNKPLQMSEALPNIIEGQGDADEYNLGPNALKAFVLW